ncbi:viral A-type inclusion protein, putative [Trichomonas vaginalis G3]|uniref:Viral A-type inclusion protein, putative n=1 Tax=Trichomonas vaginalis (strain ATCC PRA-98 / G3) TaxID=412133 RepID=A2E7U2_TRIV3|nr:biological adhesion protein [Trichomonas vaginalis G3]EAY11273.1 viral A-type inclusion protein, putative [Trichomonas vaginalis G3]KAI5553200.1 biological adhesion protein [Trichomonas vaginalis G3]|eukprot:XP_001323496.1 viral A-type inclusion protein [Trichomonas vaginalis G3]
MSRRPTALKFNVNKKLSQLMKVIQFFQSQLSEQKYQKDYLNNYFNPLINETLDGYRSFAAKSSEEVEKQVGICNEKIEKQFKEKLLTLQSDQKAYIDANRTNLAKFETKITSDAQDILKAIEEINNQFINCQEDVSKMADQYPQQLNQILQTENEKFKAEVEELNKESKRRLDELKETNKKNLQELEEQHQKDILELKNSNDPSNKKTNAINKKFSALKQKCQSLKDTMANLKNNINDLQKQNSTYLKGIKDKVRAQSSELSMFEKEKKAKNDMRREQIKLLLQDYENKQETQQNILKSNQEMHKEEIAEARKNAKKEVDEMKIKFSDESQRIRNQYDDLDAAFQSLIKKYEEELNKLKQKHEAFIEQSNAKLKDKSNEIEVMVQENQKEIQKYQDELNALSKELEDKKAALNSKHEENINKENERYENKKKQILEKQDLSSQGMESETREKTRQLNETLSKIDTLRQQFEKEINDFENETNSIAENQSVENDSKFVEFSDSKKNEIEQIKQENKQKIENLTNDEQNEIENLKKQLEDEYNKAINDVHENGLSKTEIPEFVAKYKEIFDKENIKFNDIGDLPQEDFSMLDSEIKMLEMKIDEQARLDAEEKQKIISDFEKKTIEENDRHNKYMENFPPNPDENLLKDVEKQISNEKQLKENDEKYWNDKIENESSTFNQKNSELEEKLKELEDTTEIDNLNNMIKDLKEELEKLNNEANLSVEMRAEEHKKRLANEKDKFEKLKQDLDDQMSKLYHKHNEDKEQLQKDLEESASRESAALDNAKDLSEKMKLAEKREFERTRDQLKHDIEDLKKTLLSNEGGIGKALASNSARRKSEEKVLIDEKEEIIKNILKEWDAMRIFYDEKIDVLQGRIETAKRKLQTMSPRPQDKAMIEKLTNDLSLVTYRLKNAALEFKKARELTMTQEKVYNGQFGQHMKVGVALPVSKSSMK